MSKSRNRIAPRIGCLEWVDGQHVMRFWFSCHRNSACLFFYLVVFCGVCVVGEVCSCECVYVWFFLGEREIICECASCLIPETADKIQSSMGRERREERNEELWQVNLPIQYPNILRGVNTHPLIYIHTHTHHSLTRELSLIVKKNTVRLNNGEHTAGK